MYTTIGDSWMSPFKIVYHFGPERSQNLNQQWAVRAAAVLSFRRRPVISEDLALLANGANDLWRCSQRNFWGRATRIGHSHCLTVFMVVDTFGFSFQTRRFNPCRLSEFFISRYSHLHRSNIRHHAQSSFPNNNKNVFWFVPSSVRAAFFFPSLIDSSLWHILSYSCYSQTFQEVLKRIGWLCCITEKRLCKNFRLALWLHRVLRRPHPRNSHLNHPDPSTIKSVSKNNYGSEKEWKRHVICENITGGQAGRMISSSSSNHDSSIYW